MIAFKSQIVGTRESVLKRTGEHKIYDMFDIIAKQYGVTRIRKVGHVWLGVFGFFDGSEALNNALDFR